MLCIKRYKGLSRELIDICKFFDYEIYRKNDLQMHLLIIVFNVNQAQIET